MRLILSEKPSVARSIAAIAGANVKKDGYWEGGGNLVSWCYGHLVTRVAYNSKAHTPQGSSPLNTDVLTTGCHR